MRRALLLVLCLMWALPCIALADMEIHFLNVGDADAAVIMCDGEVMIVDAGEPAHSQFIYSYLRNTLNIETVKYVVISHPHDDHIGGIPAVMNACKVETVLSPVVYYPGEPFEDVLRIAQEQQVSFLVANLGDVLTVGGAECHVVAPLKTTTNINDLSIVMLIEYGETRFLFTGDIEKNSEEVLVNSWEDIRADVLKVAHHGRDTSSTHTFLRVVDADYYVVSGGSNLTKNVRERLDASGGAVYVTEEVGTILCQSDGKEITFTFKDTKKALDQTTNDESQGTDIYYVGNVRSKKYHLHWCDSVKTMAEKNRVVFDTRQEALDNGYTGCGTCKP